MPRAVFVLVLAVLALLAPATAEAARPAHLVVAGGSARAVGGELRGWFLVVNRGDARSRATEAVVSVRVGKSPLGATIIWRVRRVTVPPLAPSRSRRFRFAVAIAEEFGAARSPIRACIEGCRQIGRLSVTRRWEREQPAGSSSRADTAGAPAAGPPLDGDIAPPPPISTVPTDPIAYVAGEPFEVTSGAVPYWAFVPSSYDPSHLTPAPLLVWLHGCGGESAGDIWLVDPGAEGEPQDWLTIAVGGREGECWTPSVDEAKVMAAIADVETHFDVDRRRVFLGGYSSGGDLAYRTGFRHSGAFAGLLIENSSPFRDTESSAAESLAAATTKLHIVHLAHTGDTTYPLAGVRAEIGEVEAAGFPVELVERPGTHYDANTEADLRAYLLPRIDDD